METSRRRFLGSLAATTALTCVAPQVVAKQEAVLHISGWCRSKAAPNVWLDSAAPHGGDGSEPRPFNSLGAVLAHAEDVCRRSGAESFIAVYVKKGAEFRGQIDLSGHSVHWYN